MNEDFHAPQPHSDVLWKLISIFASRDTTHILYVASDESAPKKNIDVDFGALPQRLSAKLCLDLSINGEIFGFCALMVDFGAMLYPTLRIMASVPARFQLEKSRLVDHVMRMALFCPSKWISLRHETHLRADLTVGSMMKGLWTHLLRTCQGERSLSFSFLTALTSPLQDLNRLVKASATLHDLLLNGRYS